MLDRLDYYRLLRIERDATGPKVREAFHNMRRGFHPDAFHGREPELRVAVAEIAKRVNEGYQVLRDSARRAAYNRALDQGQLRYSAETEESMKTAEAAHGGTTPNGKRFFSQSETAERAGDFETAISTLKMAITFERENQHFQARLEDLQARAPKKKKSNPHAIKWPR
jgi:DnaJ-class molecular chaperone